MMSDYKILPGAEKHPGFILVVHTLRKRGMADEYVAREIVDIAYKRGYDLTFQQHIVEKLVRRVPLEKGGIPDSERTGGTGRHHGG